MSRGPLCLAVVVAACGGGPGAAPRPAGPAPRTPAASAPTPGLVRGPELVFRGMCDASGAIALPGGRIAVVDDEVNQLVIYRASGGTALQEIPLDGQLGLDAAGREADLEAAASDGDHLILAASHGRTRKGKLAPSRLRLARVRIDRAAGALTLAREGEVYTGLGEALLASPDLAAFDLAAAMARSPKQPGGFNLEGLAPGPDDELVLGVRSPLFDGRALVIVVGEREPFAGQPARVRRHALLDLGGRGVRDVVATATGFLIAAGAPLDQPVGAALYRWNGHDQPERLVLDLAGLNVEAVAVLDGGRVLILSDDGSAIVEGQPCKKLPDPTRRRFRGALLTPR